MINPEDNFDDFDSIFTNSLKEKLKDNEKHYNQWNASNSSHKDEKELKIKEEPLSDVPINPYYTNEEIAISLNQY